MISTELLEEYLATSFIVYQKEIVIKIDKQTDKLDKVLKDYNVLAWSFITAHNPFSNILSEEENDNRHNELLKLTKHYVVFEGEGQGRDPQWKPEKSLLILGISRGDAIKLGNYYKQNAIVTGEYNKPAELLILNI